MASPLRQVRLTSYYFARGSYTAKGCASASRSDKGRISPVNVGGRQSSFVPKSEHPGHSILRRCSILVPSGKMRLFGKG